MEEMRNSYKIYKIFVGKPAGQRPLWRSKRMHAHTYEKIILKWILKAHSMIIWTRFIWLRTGICGSSRRTLLHGVSYNLSSSSSSCFQGLGLLAWSSSKFIFWNLWIYWTAGRIPWTGDRPDARPLPTHSTTRHRKPWTHIHASSRIWTHDPSVWVAEDSMCLRLLGQWDQLL
jgi:hypothetical protein